MRLHCKAAGWLRPAAARAMTAPRKVRRARVFVFMVAGFWRAGGLWLGVVGWSATASPGSRGGCLDRRMLGSRNGLRMEKYTGSPDSCRCPFAYFLLSFCVRRLSLNAVKGRSAGVALRVSPGHQYRRSHLLPVLGQHLGDVAEQRAGVLCHRSSTRQDPCPAPTPQRVLLRDWFRDWLRSCGALLASHEMACVAR